MAMLCWAAGLSAQAQGTLAGTILDPLGSRVPGAVVQLIHDGVVVEQATSSRQGTFDFAGLEPGRYQVVVTAEGFEARSSELVYVGSGSRVSLEMALAIGPLQQDVLVTAEATALEQARVVAQVTVVDRETLEALDVTDVAQALRLAPGAQVMQQGGQGGGTQLFLRGGNSNFAKVVVDGVPVNDLGGYFDFSRLTTTGLERVEVLRQSNSAIYGSNALTGVVSLETRRGRSRTPEMEYTVDGGNLGTLRSGLSLGGVFRRVDYFSEYSRSTTDNHQPRSGYSTESYAGRFGVAVGASTNVSATMRFLDSRREPNTPLELFGISDDGLSTTGQQSLSVVADSQWTNRWRTSVRFGSTSLRLHSEDPSPTGELVYPFWPNTSFSNYLGGEVTLTGPGGRSVTGRAVLDSGFSRYPFVSEFETSRWLLSGQTSVQLGDGLTLSAGGRLEHEGEQSAANLLGFVASDVPWRNGGAFLETRGALGRRIHFSAALGAEYNTAFQTAYSPRVSVAAFPRRPSAAFLGETKVSFNAGKGVKAPSASYWQSSLYELVKGTPAGEDVRPVGPEHSRGVDVGLEQTFAGGRARARVVYFDNRFRDLIEILSKQQLLAVGVRPEVVAELAFGAAVNSGSYSARGIELSGDARMFGGFALSGSYSFLDAVVESTVFGPAFNPAFPGVPIGSFWALPGERPLYRATHSGALSARYVDGPVSIAVSGSFVGARDDTVLLNDPAFGNSLRLPNQDLGAAYQLFDLSGSYRVHRRLRLYATIGNVLNREYAARYGYRSLPFTIRSGAAVTIGGDRSATPVQ